MLPPVNQQFVPPIQDEGFTLSPEQEQRYRDMGLFERNQAPSPQEEEVKVYPWMTKPGMRFAGQVGKYAPPPPGSPGTEGAVPAVHFTPHATAKEPDLGGLMPPETGQKKNNTPPKWLAAIAAPVVAGLASKLGGVSFGEAMTALGEGVVSEKYRQFKQQRDAEFQEDTSLIEKAHQIVGEVGKLSPSELGRFPKLNETVTKWKQALAESSPGGKSVTAKEAREIILSHTAAQMSGELEAAQAGKQKRDIHNTTTATGEAKTETDVRELARQLSAMQEHQGKSPAELRQEALRILAQTQNRNRFFMPDGEGGYIPTPAWNAERNRSLRGIMHQDNLEERRLDRALRYELADIAAGRSDDAKRLRAISDAMRAYGTMRNAMGINGQLAPQEEVDRLFQERFGMSIQEISRMVGQRASGGQVPTTLPDDVNALRKKYGY